MLPKNDDQSVISMSDQLKNFKEYIGKLKGVVGEEGANKTISNSLFLLSAGNNDIAIIYLDTPSRAFQYDVPTYTSLLVSWTSTFIKVRIMLLYILLFASTYWIQHFTLYSTLKRQYLPRFSLHCNCRTLFRGQAVDIFSTILCKFLWRIYMGSEYEKLVFWVHCHWVVYR